MLKSLGMCEWDLNQMEDGHEVSCQNSELSPEGRNYLNLPRVHVCVGML